VFLLAKSSFPSPKTPTVLSQQELGNPVGKAFAKRVGVTRFLLCMLMPTPAPLPAAAPVADSGDDQEEAERRHPMSESAHDSFVIWFLF
jgi:hypothetical protein